MDEARLPSTLSTDNRTRLTVYVIAVAGADGTVGIVGTDPIDVMLQAASVPQCLGYAGGVSERKI